MLRNKGAGKLNPYNVGAKIKNCEFWQQDSLAVPLFTRKVALQKLNYPHNNPLAERRNFVKDSCDYEYSSARYYKLDEKNFPFLKDLLEEI